MVSDSARRARPGPRLRILQRIPVAQASAGPVTDTAPVGDGLKVIGFAMLGAACVVVLGRLIR